MRKSIIFSRWVLVSFACAILILIYPTGEFGLYTSADNIKSAKVDDWVTVQLSNVTFSIPSNMLKQDVHGSDSLFYKYANDKMSVSLETESGSESLKQFEDPEYVKTFRKKEVSYDGVKRTQLDYQYFKNKTKYDDLDKRFGKAIGFDCADEIDNVTLLVLFSDVKDDDIAEQIVKSVSLTCSQ